MLPNRSSSGASRPSWAAPSPRSSSATAPCSASRVSPSPRTTCCGCSARSAAIRSSRSRWTWSGRRCAAAIVSSRPGSPTARATSSSRGRGAPPACCWTRATRSRPPRAACRTSRASDPGASSRADRPHADPRDRLRGVGGGGGRAGRPPPWLPRRRARLGRGSPTAGRPPLPGARALPARLRAHALPRRGRAAHGAAGRDRPGPPGLHGRGRHRAGRARRLRLGRARGLHRGHPGSRAGARPRHDRRLQRAEHGGATPARLRRGGARRLVPVVLQYRARASRAGEEPPRDLPTALAGLVAGLALRRRDLRAGGGRLRQPRLRPGGDPLLPASPPPCPGRPALRRDRGAPRPAAPHRGAERDPARRRRRGRLPQSHRATPRHVPGRDRAARDPGRRPLPPPRAARRGRGRAAPPAGPDRAVGRVWFLLAVVAALCQVLRNTVMKRLGHSLDEYINVWGRFTFLLPFAGAFVLWNGVPELKPGFYLACASFAVCQTISTMALSKALKLAEISMVTALWKVSLLILVVMGYTLLAALFFAPSVVTIKWAMQCSDQYMGTLGGYEAASLLVTPIVLGTSRRHFVEVPRYWKAFVSFGLFASLTTISQGTAYLMTLSS